MLLLRQFPAASMPMSMSSVSFPSLATSLPSNSSVLLSLLASLVLLSFIRAAFLCLRTTVGKQTQPQSQVQVQGKSTEKEQETRQQRSSWAWGLLTWDSLPAVTLTLPVSLTIVDNNTNGRGVGMQEKREERPNQGWQPPRSRRGGPAFESPRS